MLCIGNGYIHDFVKEKPLSMNVSTFYWRMPTELYPLCVMIWTFFSLWPHSFSAFLVLQHKMTILLSTEQLFIKKNTNDVQVHFISMPLQMLHYRNQTHRCQRQKINLSGSHKRASSTQQLEMRARKRFMLERRRFVFHIVKLERNESDDEIAHTFHHRFRAINMATYNRFDNVLYLGSFCPSETHTHTHLWR